MSDPLMDIAWRDFVMFAFSQPEAVAAFNAETGRKWLTPRSGFDAMIDAATGKEDDDARAFVLWVTRTQWGVEHAPDAVRAEIAGEGV